MAASGDIDPGRWERELSEVLVQDGSRFAHVD